MALKTKAGRKFGQANIWDTAGSDGGGIGVVLDRGHDRPIVVPSPQTGGDDLAGLALNLVEDLVQPA